MLPSNMEDYQGVQSKSKEKSARETRFVLQWPTHQSTNSTLREPTVSKVFIAVNDLVIS